MEEPSDLIFLSPEEEEAAVAEVEVEVEASVEAVEETEVEVEASVEEEAEDTVETEVEVEVEDTVEIEVEVEAEEEASEDHQEEDSTTTPVAHLTAKCCEHFERLEVAETNNNYKTSFISGCLLLPRG